MQYHSLSHICVNIAYGGRFFQGYPGTVRGNCSAKYLQVNYLTSARLNSGSLWPLELKASVSNRLSTESETLTIHNYSYFSRIRTSGFVPCCQNCRPQRSTRCTPSSSYSPHTPPNLHQIGSYHYVSGVDASSSASLAAYINSLTYALEDSNAWFSKGPTWKVRNGCYWCVFAAVPPQASSPVNQLLQRVLASGYSYRCQNPWWSERICYRSSWREVRKIREETTPRILTSYQGTLLRQKSGKKPIYQLYYVQSCTRTIHPIG